MYSILCDYDGTIINDNNSIDEKYIDMLKDICDNNIFFLLSSSSYNELINFKNKYSLNINIYSLSSNIMYINNEVKFTGLSKYIINTLINDYNRYIYTAYSESANDTLIYRFQDRLDMFYPKNNRKNIIHVDDDRPSVTFVLDNRITEDFYKRIHRFHLGYQSIAKDKNREIIMVFCKRISKSDGYYYLKDEYPNNKIIGITDSFFDYDMIDKCDIKIAMRNGDDKIKNNSDIITKYDNNNGGAIIELYNICHLK